MWSRPLNLNPSLDPPQSAPDVPGVVDRLLQAAVAAQVSDIHVTPRKDFLQICFRRDGVLHPWLNWPKSLSENLVNRLKVLARLLTYRNDIPQEGRLHTPWTSAELRLSTFPTLHGERAVIRLFIGSGRYQYLHELDFPPDLLNEWQQLLEETSGLLVISGPAGSGKTTTAYASLRYLSQRFSGMKSLVSLEDPIEAELPEVSQSLVHRPSDFTYSLGLRSLMRQDPDVILVGEIRDRETAETSFQASLTGHLVLTTFHAGSAADTINRLSDLGIEPYILRTGLRGVLSQRLLRTYCCCAISSVRTSRQPESNSLPESPAITNAVCSHCSGTGYAGRLLIAELMRVESPEITRAILDRAPAERIRQVAEREGMIPLLRRAQEYVQAGKTSWEEVQRVLGRSAWVILQDSQPSPAAS